MLVESLVMAAAFGTLMAQRLPSISICDHYTAALFGNNTASNQQILLNLITNAAILHSSTQPNIGTKVADILASTIHNVMSGKPPLNFDSSSVPTDRGESTVFVEDPLDGGSGAAPPIDRTFANSINSRQHALLAYLSGYLGFLLECSLIEVSWHPHHSGRASMYKIHEFMGIFEAEVDHFTRPIVDLGEYIGVAKDDLADISNALTGLFDVRCSSVPTTVTTPKGRALQGICIDDSRPIAPDASYDRDRTCTESSSASLSSVPRPTATITARDSTSEVAVSENTVTLAWVIYGVTIVAIAGGFAVMLL